MLCLPELVDDPRFRNNEDRVTHREQINHEIENKFLSLNLQDLVDLLDRNGIANAHMRSVQEALDHPQWKFQNHWTTVQTSSGALQAMKPVVEFENDKFPDTTAVPEVGQHTREVLQEFLGYSPQLVDELYRDGVL